MNKLRFLACTALLTAAGATHARTALQDRIFAEPMPHTRIAPAGRPVKVHHVRLEVDAPELRRALQTPQLVRKAVEACVYANSRTGVRSNPPRELPTLFHPMHVDTYYARNREIAYSRGYGFLIRPDCSLDERESFTATLSSRNGACKIDMLARTATGLCDADGHAGAPPVVALTAGQQHEARETMARLAHIPGMTAVGAMLANTAPPGATRRVLGVECDVIIIPAQQHKSCSAKGGSFARPGIIIDAEVGGMPQTAREVKLDAALTNAIFTPYLAPGFRVTAGQDEQD